MNKEYFCPVCQSNDYEVVDFTEDYTDLGGSIEWKCTCNNCGTRFNILCEYEYTNTIITQESEEEEE